MDKEEMIDQLYRTSYLDLLPALKMLVQNTQAEVKIEFSVENIDIYCRKLSGLRSLIACLTDLSGPQTNVDVTHTEPQVTSLGPMSVTEKQFNLNEKASIAEEVLNNICLPLLHCVHPSIDTRKEILVLLGSICDLLSAAAVCDKTNSVLNSLLGTCIGYLDIFLVEKPSTSDVVHNKELLDIYSVVEVLRTVLVKACDESMVERDDMLKGNINNVFDKCVQVADLIDVDLVGSICVPLFIRLLSLDSHIVVEKMNKIWDLMKNLTKGLTKTRNEDRKVYILLCGFANYFFPVSGICVCTDLRCDEKFWAMLQNGLLSKDSVNRKRSLYLLKRIVDICETNCLEVNNSMVADLANVPVFSWSKKNAASLTKIWQDLILLLEVFEDKQVHIIKPLLPRMKTLIAVSSHSNSEPPLLHTSWLTTVFSRCLHHESLQIIRWAAESVLSLDYTSCPMLQQQQAEFLCGPFLYALQEPKLFVRDQGSAVGSMPEVAERLTQFFPAIWKALSPVNRRSFFSKTIQNICSGVWGPIPLVYICKGLTFVPQSACLDRETITGMREFLSGFIATVDTYIRGAIQCFCVEVLLNLTDTSDIPPEEFFHILSLFRSEDCLQRGTTLWSQCSEWLNCTAEETDASWNADAIQKLIETGLTRYLQTTLDSKYSTGDVSNAQQLSRLLLLGSDATIATRSTEDKASTLVMVTETLVSVINSINSHAYMSTHKADKAVQLMVVLVKDLGTKGVSEEKRNRIAKSVYPDEKARYDCLIWIYIVCKNTNFTVSKTVLKSLGDCLMEMELYLSRQIPAAFQTLSDLPLLYLYCDTVKTVMSRIENLPATSIDRLARTCLALLDKHYKDIKSTDQDLSNKLSHLAAMSVVGTMAALMTDTTNNSSVSGDTTEPSFSKKTDGLRLMISDFAKRMELDLKFSKPSDPSLSQQEWGKVVSLYLQSQWEILHLAVLSIDLWCEPTDLLDLARETLSVCVGETAIPVIHCIRLLLPDVVSSKMVPDSEIGIILDACWISLEESRRHPQYWQTLTAFIQAIYQPFLVMAPEESTIITKLNKFASDLVTMGEERNGVVNILVDQLFSTWTKSRVTAHIAKFLPMIVDLCMFGNIQKKGERQLFDVCASIEALGSKCSVNELKDSISNQDVLVRATILSFLCTLNPANGLHCHLVTDIMKLTIARYVELSVNQSLTFANSLVHRQRHRLVQLLLLTQSFIQDPFLPTMWKFLWTSLEQEHQPSIRHMLEWEVMWLMYQHKELREQIWPLFDKYRETKNMVLCSLLCIVIHMGPHLPHEEQEDYYNRAIPSILPWCLAHHFNTRIFAQATLCKLWDQCKQLELASILKAHSILQTLVDFNQGNSANALLQINIIKLQTQLFKTNDVIFVSRTSCREHLQQCYSCLNQKKIQPKIKKVRGMFWLKESVEAFRNSTKNVKKLLDSFFFKFLDFRRDFSVETLFHTLPSMTALAEEDWIPPAVFIQANRQWSDGKGSCFIQLNNETDQLKTCDPGFWRWRGGLNAFDDEAADGTTSSAEGDGDVQKKIMPWKQMVPDDETAQEINFGVKQHKQEGLIVVTSLISKIPNLGGLCRTSEIFGVSEYVLGKLHYTDDKAFQGLSVTAHKWVPITEVHESKLPDYLHQKRQEGYTLVGVEQTANSVCLTDYTFPVKTLLLLGNEKEGIPVDLISLLDVCVEIPQQGVIRSLNVHVSGALLIWEYRRQQLVKLKS